MTGIIKATNITKELVEHSKRVIYADEPWTKDDCEDSWMDIWTTSLTLYEPIKADGSIAGWLESSVLPDTYEEGDEDIEPNLSWEVIDTDTLVNFIKESLGYVQFELLEGFGYDPDTRAITKNEKLEKEAYEISKFVPNPYRVDLRLPFPGIFDGGDPNFYKEPFIVPVMKLIDDRRFIKYNKNKSFTGAL